MSRAYYGQAAYEGFAKAFGSLLGIDAAAIRVQSGDGPSIDVNGVLHLPGMSGYQDADDFETTCGSIVHEMAHLWCRSHRELAVRRTRLAMDCLNAVLDVADETALARDFARRGLGRPGDLLRRGNQRHLPSRGGGYCPVFDWSPAARTPVHWRVLAAGIIVTRLSEQSEKAKLPRSDQLMVGRCRRRTIGDARNHPANIDARAVFAVLARARTTGTARKPMRTLVRLASELETLLAAVAPPEGQTGPGEPMPGQGKPGGPSPDGSTTVSAVPSFGTEAGAEAGADAARAPAKGDAAGQQAPVSATADSRGASGGGEGAEEGLSPSETARRMCGPAVAAIARRIANDGQGTDRESGYARGGSVAEPYRLVTDGLCMSRWQEEMEADGMSVAVLLDCSGSMGHVLASVAGVAQAFAQEMRECGDVKCWAFGSLVRESHDDYEHPRTMGGTQTGSAIAAANQWLQPRRGAKWIVLITDGCADSPESAKMQALYASQMGVKILSVGFGRYVPLAGAINVTAMDVPHLAIELQGAAAMIGAGILRD